MINNLLNGWKIEKLGDTYVSNIIMGQSPDSKTYNKDKIGLPFYQGKKDFGKKYPNPSEYCSAPKKVAERNDILFCVRAPVGITNISTEKCCIGRGLSAIRVNSNNCLMDYIRYFFIKNEKFIADKGKGSTFTAITKNDLENILVPIPPLQQQEKIVKVLDLTSNLIEKQKELLEKYDLFLKSKFIEMFGDPILNPKNWENDILLNTCPNKGDFVDGPFGSNLKISDRMEEGIRIIQINNVGENEFRDKNKAYISYEKYITLKRHEVLKNDIIIAKMGEPIARSCFLPNHIDKAIIVADCMRMRITNHDYNRVFICFYLNFYTTKVLIGNLSHGSTRTRINLSILKTLEIIKPPIELQNKFASIVEKIETIKEKENKKLKQMNDLHNSLMQKAFKGEIL